MPYYLGDLEDHDLENFRKANLRKMEQGFSLICAVIPYTLRYVHEDNDVPTFLL